MVKQVITVKVKRIGNLLGILLPKEIVREQRIKQNDEISLNIVTARRIQNNTDLKPIFGSLKGTLTISGQKLKNMVRQGWQK